MMMMMMSLLWLNNNSTSSTSSYIFLLYGYGFLICSVVVDNKKLEDKCRYQLDLYEKTWDVVRQKYMVS